MVHITSYFENLNILCEDYSAKIRDLFIFNPFSTWHIEMLKRFHWNEITTFPSYKSHIMSVMGSEYKPRRMESQYGKIGRQYINEQDRSFLPKFISV